MNDTIILYVVVAFGIAMAPIVVWFIINMYVMILEDIRDWLSREI